MDELFAGIVEFATENGEVNDLPNPEKVKLVYQHQCLSRNRRYIFAYLNHRLGKIRNLRWEIGAVVPENIGPKLSSRENDFFMEYNNILTDYCATIQLDLTSDLEVGTDFGYKCMFLILQQPPRDLLVEIRALKDIGEIMTESGSVSLVNGSTHFLRR